MASKEELKKLLKKEHIYNVLEKHHEVDELISFLEIIKDNDFYYDADSVLRRFPKSSLYDKYKTAIIDEAAPTDKENLIIYGLIELIVDDNTKLEYLEKYRSKF